MVMQEHRYLLNIKELEDADERGELWQRVIHMLDADRLRKFQKIGHKNGRAACAGAGLLLQQAY